MAHENYGGIRLEDVGGLEDALDAKSAETHPHANIARRPVVVVIPSGNVIAVITHPLNTLDVDIEVVEFSTRTTVLVPFKRLSATQIEFTFTVAPTTGQYVAIVSPGAGISDDAEQPEMHAATHAIGGDDPLPPADIGAAPAVHTHNYADPVHAHSAYQPLAPLATANHTHAYQPVGNYAAQFHSHSGLLPAGGTTGQILVKQSVSALDTVWRNASTAALSTKAYPPINVPSFYDTYVTSGNYIYRYCFARVPIDTGTHFRVDLPRFKDREQDAAFSTDQLVYVSFSGTPIPGQAVTLELRNTYTAPFQRTTSTGFQHMGWYFLGPYDQAPLDGYTTVRGSADVQKNKFNHGPDTVDQGMAGQIGNSHPYYRIVFLNSVRILTLIYDERWETGGRWRVVSSVPDFFNTKQTYSGYPDG